MRTIAGLLLMLALAGCKSATAPDAWGPLALENARSAQVKVNAWIDRDSLRVAALVDRDPADFTTGYDHGWTAQVLVHTDRPPHWGIGFPEDGGPLAVWDLATGQPLAMASYTLHGHRLTFAAPLSAGGAPLSVVFVVNEGPVAVEYYEAPVRLNGSAGSKLFAADTPVAW